MTRKNINELFQKPFPQINSPLYSRIYYQLKKISSKYKSSGSISLSELGVNHSV